MNEGKIEDQIDLKTLSTLCQKSMDEIASLISAAENKILLKQYKDAETDLFELIKTSQNTLDKTDIYILLVTLYSIVDPAKGLQCFIEFLRELGESYDLAKIDYSIKKLNANTNDLDNVYNYFCFYFYIIDKYHDAYFFIKKIELLEEILPAHETFFSGKTLQALTLTSLYKNHSIFERFSTRRKLKKIQNFLKNCPNQQADYFSPNYYLVSAEIASLNGSFEKALKLYNHSVSSSLIAENWLSAAMSYELAAKFLLRIEQSKLAKPFMQEAHHYYSRWEGYAKAKLLEESYPPWFKDDRNESVLSSKSSNLDYLSIIKSTQALSSEIILNKLLARLMRLLLENAGAQRGLLLMERGQKLYLEAEASSQEEVCIKKQSLEERKDIPRSLIYYVQHTKKTVVLHNASEEELFSKDPYIRENGLKSIICYPILSQSKAIGFLYLENNATVGAFTKERLEALSVLSTQAAISIENAQFYSTLEEKVADRTKELKRMQNQLIQQEKLASLGMLTSGIAHELKNPLNFILNFSDLSSNEVEKALDEIANKNAMETNLSEFLLDLKENLSKIEDHSKRADKIIQGMLVHSRQVTSKSEFVDIHLHLDQALKLVTQKYSKMDEGFIITIKKNYDPHLKKIEGFPTQLDQVFENVLDNACYALFEKFKKSGRNFTATLEATSQGFHDHIVIKIKDNGLGISKEILSKIYEPFFTTKPPGAGTGLGLFFVYDIITKQHNGTIEVKSETDQSTEFIITLPKQQLGGGVV